MERFKLAAHFVAKEQSVLALVAGKGGPKLKEWSPDVAPPSAPDKDVLKIQGRFGVDAVVIREESQITTPSRGTRKSIVTEDGVTHWEFTKMTTKELVGFLTGVLRQPVLDMTGLTGLYQISMDILRRTWRFRPTVQTGPQFLQG